MLTKTKDPFNWQRLLIAVSAIVLSLAGVIAHFLPNVDEGSSRFIAGTCWKIAVVLAITWLASPQIERLGWQRIRGSLLAALVIVIILYSIRPRIGAIAAAVLVLCSALAATAGWIRRWTQHP